MNELENLPNKKLVENDAWQSLKAFTSARIALGRTGSAMPLKEVLEFKLAHAHARDAVYSFLNEPELRNDLAAFNIPTLVLNSQASDRNQYLKRPDAGRLLNEDSIKLLQSLYAPPCDVAMILADGLSATAINKHAVPLFQLLVPMLSYSNFSIAPLTIVHQARVAIGDSIGYYLNARYSIVLIGERPGLSSPDSLGVYLTYKPTIGLTDESRNCISNIRLEGMSYKAAAEKILYLVRESFRLQYSGVALKDNSELRINQENNN